MITPPPPTAEQLVILAAFSLALGWLWYWHLTNMGRLRKSALPLWVKIVCHLVVGALMFVVSLAALYAELVMLNNAAG